MKKTTRIRCIIYLLTLFLVSGCSANSRSSTNDKTEKETISQEKNDNDGVEDNSEDRANGEDKEDPSDEEDRDALSDNSSIGETADTESTDLTNLKSVKIYAGKKNSAFIDPYGTLYITGSNQYGQLGYEGNDSSVYVEVMRGVKKAAISALTVAAIKKNGDLFMWGDYYNTTEPQKIMQNVRDVSITGNSFAAVTEDGSLYVWGDFRNDFGEGLSIDSDPVKIRDNVSNVSIGGDGYGESMAFITRDKELYTVGRNEHGELGNGTTYDTSMPEKIMDDIKSVSVGDSHMAAITVTGDLYTWGANYMKQLGDGSNISSSTPLKVKENIENVCAGDVVTIAVGTDGTVSFWGNDSHGSLGEGMITNGDGLTSSISNLQFKDVSTSGWTTLLLTEEGEIYAFGYNENGQLGTGENVGWLNPYYILNVKKVDASTANSEGKKAEDLKITKDTVINVDMGGSGEKVDFDISFKGLNYYLGDTTDDHEIAIYISDGINLLMTEYEAENPYESGNIFRFVQNGASSSFYGGSSDKVVCTVSEDNLHVSCDLSEYGMTIDNIKYISVNVHRISDHTDRNISYSVNSGALQFIDEVSLLEYLGLY